MRHAAIQNNEAVMKAVLRQLVQGYSRAAGLFRRGARPGLTRADSAGQRQAVMPMRHNLQISIPHFQLRAP